MLFGCPVRTEHKLGTAAAHHSSSAPADSIASDPLRLAERARETAQPKPYIHIYVYIYIMYNYVYIDTIYIYIHMIHDILIYAMEKKKGNIYIYIYI